MPRLLLQVTVASLVLVSCARAHPSTAWRPSPAVEREVLLRSPAVPADARAATVTRVVDGDTLVARLATGPPVRVRLIGVDTPETVKPGAAVGCFGEVASTYAKRLLRGAVVRVAYEPGGRTDRYGRQLWDVWLPGGQLVAGLLVADGLGRAYPYQPQVRFAPLLERLQAQARAARRGLWGAPCHGHAFSTPDRTWPPA